VLYASGNQNSGLSVFVLDDHLLFDYNCVGDHHVVIDGVACGTLAIPFVMRMISSAGASVGRDHGSAVSRDYRGPGDHDPSVGTREPRSAAPGLSGAFDHRPAPPGRGRMASDECGSPAVS